MKIVEAPPPIAPPGARSEALRRALYLEAEVRGFTRAEMIANALVGFSTEYWDAWDAKCLQQVSRTHTNSPTTAAGRAMTLRRGISTRRMPP